MKSIVITPPIVQLNSPYPSGAYLKAFYHNQKVDCEWFDLNISLYYQIFSRSGLEKLFAFSEKSAIQKSKEFLKKGDEDSAFILKEYLENKEKWIEWIDTITGILSGKLNREAYHRFIFSPFSPKGNRMFNYLESLERLPTTDDAHFLASLALADLADYINVAFDSNFSLVRYAESLAINEKSFEEYKKCLTSPVLENFYRPVLEETFSSVEKGTIVNISVPFAGTLAFALYTGKFFKDTFGDQVTVFLGGGFVNTELRDVNLDEFKEYTDGFCYDRGYGQYLKLLDERQGRQCRTDEEYKRAEKCLTRTLVPDYRDIDFSIYPRMIDDVNPMQRLWSDGCWIKAYLAHGCYWHKCAFCDTTLDYVKSYEMTEIETLFFGLLKQCEAKGIYGIHFVDEALPPVAAKKFAELNIANGNKLTWWGNVRFEKTYTYELAELLSKGGLIGVSGGVEIATGSGLDSINKGTDIQSIVNSMCAFKENGILVHAYMIYGYYGETDLDTINSMETLRQLYSHDLIDSCFWHKFVLTRHSTLYDEWEKGLHKDLVPIESENSGVFAKNGLHFKGEEASAKYGEGLNNSLNAWMHGEHLNTKVNKWFNFETPKTTIKPNLIDECIENYEKTR